MCKRLVVEAKSKASKEANINGKSHIGVGIPQSSKSTLNGLEATTKPTNRRRQRYLQVTHICRRRLDAS